MTVPSIAETGTSIQVLPAAGSPLPAPCKFVIVGTAGNMGLVFADGTNNDSALVAVTPGMWFPVGPVSASASNTAGLLAVG